MFKKLISNLPFNPSMITQLGFYADRLKKEDTIRRIGFLIIILVMFVQIFAVVSPSEKSLASSANHIIDGLRTRSDILAAWDRKGSDIPAIYGKFGVVRSDIESLSYKPNSSIKSTDGNNWWTIGRNSLLGYSGIAQKYKDSQITLQFAGKDTASPADDRFIYNRELRAWDVRKPSNTYQAFKGKISKTGENFWILVDCGNLTKIGPYSEPAKPGLSIRKTIIDKPAYLEPGDTYSYLIEYRNTVSDSLAKDVFIEDELDLEHFEVISPKDLPINNGLLRYEVGSLAYSSQYKTLTMTVRLKDQISSGTSICNISRIISSNTSAVLSDPVCIGVITPCPYDGNVDNPNCSAPVVVCSIVDTAVNLKTRKVDFRTSVTSTYQKNTSIYGYTYDFGDNSDTIKNTSASFTDSISHTYSAGDYIAKVAISYGVKGVEGKQKIECTSPIHFDKAFGQSKTVKNITQDRDGKLAINTKVKAGDVLEYTLTTTNSQNYDREDTTISDYIGDILDYAVLNKSFLQEQKGAYDKDTGKIIWENVTVPANSKVMHIFRVTVKNPIPATNSPSSTSTTYDCKISNSYGNEITIDVNCPLVKGLETLPNTGPGTNLITVSVITTVAGYFFARSRLLRKEISIIRKDYSNSGGM